MAANTSSQDVALSTMLSSLQTSSSRTIIDLVDKLRRCGLHSVLSLPQIVVVGDQSSGKSSVLEGISGIPFPRKENLCTRFATELVMRQSSEASIVGRITPDKIRSDAEKAKLLEFCVQVEAVDGLAQLFELATDAMGLNKQSEEDVRAFSADVLSIEICGPGLPQLTLVDLPGLIHARNKAQSQADVDFIRSLVKKYIEKGRSIILAVISAKNDYANQIILEHCRDTDPEGTRTLGIITKPDYLKRGSENEEKWINLALNMDVKFERGWHLLKNRSEDEMHFTLEERNAAERTFFAEGRYAELPPGMTGIEDLKTRLCELLEDHLKIELPGLQTELENDLRKTEELLAKLGSKRTTLAEQKHYLMEIGVNAHGILKAAVDGTYNQAFFGEIDSDSPISSGRNVRRLRAALQDQNLRFAAFLHRHGHKFDISIKARSEPSEAFMTREFDNASQEFNWSFGGDKPVRYDDQPAAAPPENEVSEASDSIEEPEAPENIEGPKASNDTAGQDGCAPEPTKLKRSESITWVLNILQRSRGHELPGTYNPLLISNLFWEQSSPWESCATMHLDAVHDLCLRFVNQMLDHVVPAQEVKKRLKTLKVDSKIAAGRSASRDELKRVLSDKSRHPMTYNHYFTTTVQKIKRERHTRFLDQLVQKSKTLVPVEGKKSGSYKHQYVIDPELLKTANNSQIQQDMDKVSAEDALDGLMAYYKDEMKYFIGVVTKQVIERHLATPLPDLLSPFTMASLTDDQVRIIAGESNDVVRRRKELEDRKAMLEAGQETFRQAIIGSQ